MKKYILTLILLIAYGFAQEKIPIQGIEPKQIPSKYQGNGEYQNQGKTLIDNNKNSYPQPYWGTSSPLIYDLDLGSNSDIKSIYFHDFEGGGVIRVWTGYTDNWALIGSENLNDYKKDKSISVNENTRYIRLEIDGKVSEIWIEGSGGVTPPPPPDSDIILIPISIEDTYAEFKLDSLTPESNYQISVNGKNVGSFKTKPEPTEPPKPEDFPHVVHISVDGLRPDVIERNIELFPVFSKLVRTGSYTFKAKTDPDYTVTNPNHIDMWTGLTTVEHKQTGNSQNPGTLPNSLNTVFKQVVKEGGSGIAYVAKSKLAELLGSQPIEVISDSDQDNIDAILDSDTLKNYTFLHIADPDNTGHAHSWESEQYISSVRKVDNWLAELFSGLPPDTWYIITSDHGGTGTSHGDATKALNNTIPIFIYHESLKTSRDLFKVNPDRNAIRNGETGNLALDILGMSAIPNSTLNADFSLCWDCDTTVVIPPDTTFLAQKTFDQFVGTNVLADDPASLVAPVAGNIRVYQYLKWLNNDVKNANTGAPLSQVKINFNPNDAFGFNHDASTKSFADLGETYITLFESAMYLTNNDKTWLNAVAFPRNKRSQLTDPNSWKYVSHMYFQVAARYGHAKVDPSKLITDSEKLSGLGYCSIIEGGNEKDRWWIGKDKADLTPEEHAAYYSAVYDGHMNTMQENGVYFGVKNADPTMKVMLGGLAFVDFDELLSTGKVEWFERFFRWFEENRTNPNYDTYPIDIIAYHDYPNTERKQRNLSGKGLHPEGYKWYEKTKAFVEYIEGRVTEKKLAVINNEFGYDRNQGSPQRAEPYGGFSSEQVAGMWTVRCMLEGWAAGLYSAAQFYFRENGGGGGIFQSSGLTDKNAGYKPFQMYYYFAQIRDALKGYDFVSRSVDGDMIVYEVKHRTTGKMGEVLWHYTTQNKTSTQQVQVNGSATVIQMKDNALTGDKTTKTGNSISVKVSEFPVFVLDN